MPTGVYQHKSHSHSWETREKISLALKGKSKSEEHKKKLSIVHKGIKFSLERIRKMKGRIAWNKGLKGCNGIKAGFQKDNRYGYKKCSDETIKKRSGENAYQWIEDRSKLRRQDRRDNPLYGEWRIKVWTRDNFRCRIINGDCKGRIEAHHILGWAEYPELRYEVNNGVTLCHAHHPRKRAEEKRLIPIFEELVSVSKE